MKKSAARRFSVVRTLRHVRIRYRLLASFLLLSLVPALCVGLYASGVYARAMSGKLRQSAELAAYLLNENFITELNKFRGYLNTISVTDAVQNALSAQQESVFTLDAESVNEIADALRMIPFQSTYLKNIRVVDRDHNILYDLGYDDISRERFAEVLRVIDETAGYDSLQYIRTYRNYDKIVLGRKIYKFGSVERPIGYILAYIDESFVSDALLANVSFGAGSNVMLLNEAGQVISSQDKALLGSGYLDSGTFAELRASAQAAAGQTVSAPILAGGVQALSISVYDRELNSYLVITIPQSYFTEETRQINRSLILVCVLLIVLSLLCTTVVYSSIMQPINHMVAMCNITSDADLDKSIDDQSKDELGFLARTIDNMIAEMKQLGIQYAADQRQKRKLELEMLQYPAFPVQYAGQPAVRRAAQRRAGAGGGNFLAVLAPAPFAGQKAGADPNLGGDRKPEELFHAAKNPLRRNVRGGIPARAADARLRDPALHAPAAGGERHHPRNGGRPVHYHYRGEPVQGHGY